MSVSRAYEVYLTQLRKKLEGQTVLELTVDRHNASSIEGKLVEIDRFGIHLSSTRADGLTVSNTFIAYVDVCGITYTKRA